MSWWMHGISVHAKRPRRVHKVDPLTGRTKCGLTRKFHSGGITSGGSIRRCQVCFSKGFSWQPVVRR